MIRPNRKKLDMAGMQGKIAFDPTKSDVDVQLYNEIRKFMQGEMGLGGAGGTLANKLQTPKSFQASHVFGSPDDREKVTERLNTQMTEFLQEKVGAQAIKANMTIPGFLQTKGIHGINQIGTGDDAKLSAYRRDDFVKVSQNPITGSTEKLARAALKGFGAVHEVSGGTNEKRTLTSFMRPEEAKQINKMVDNTAKKVALGLHSKGDMEPIFGTTEQREAFRLKHKANKNEIATEILEDEQNPATKEARSRILKQEAEKKVLFQAKEELYDSGELERPVAPAPVNAAEKIREDLLKTFEKKQLTAAVKQDMIDKGELPDDRPEEKKSSAAAAAKGTVMVLSKIGNVVRTIKGLVSDAVGYLQSMSNVLSSLIKNSAPLGVDRKEATQLMNWGKFHKAYNGGDPNVMLNTGKAFASNAGDILRSGKLNFDAAGLHGYAELIPMIIKGSLSKTPQPVKMMKNVFGTLAKKYFSASKEQRPAMLAEHMLVLDSVLPGTSAGYAAQVKWGEGSKKINSKNAHNIVELALKDASGKQGSGKAVNQVFGGMIDAPIGAEEDIDSLDKILGVLEQIKDALLRSILSNMDLITRVLLDIAKGVLTLAAKFGGSAAAAAGLETLKKEDAAMGKIGYQVGIESQSKIKASATEKLRKKGFSVWESDTILKNFESVEKTTRKHKNIFKGKGSRELLIDMMFYKGMREKTEEYTRFKSEGNPQFVDSGDIESHGHRNAGKINQELRKIGDTKPLHYQEIEHLLYRKKKASEVLRENSESTPGTAVHGYDSTIEEIKDNYKTEVAKDRYTPQRELPFSSSGSFADNDTAQLISSLGSRSASFMPQNSSATTPPVVPNNNQAVEVRNIVDLKINGKSVMLSNNNLSSDSKRILVSSHRAEV